MDVRQLDEHLHGRSEDQLSVDGARLHLRLGGSPPPARTERVRGAAGNDGVDRGDLDGRGVLWGRLVRGPQTRSESTRLNSSHSQISYAVFCLKKKKNKQD